MKRVLVVVLFVSLFASCVSYDIALNEELKGQEITAALIVAESSEYESMGAPDNFFAKGFYNLTLEPGIRKSYEALDLNELIADEFKKASTDEINNMKIIFDDSIIHEKLLSKEQTSEEKRENRYKIQYQLDNLKDKIDSKYVLVFKTDKWGHNGKMGKSEIIYTATLIDVKTDEIIFLSHNYFGSFANKGANIDITPEKAENSMRVIIREAIKDINTKLGL